MSAWSTVDDLIADLGLHPTEDNIKAIKKELKERIRDNHPDRTGGDFRDDKHKNYFHKLEEALRFLEGESVQGVSIIVRDQIRDLARAEAIDIVRAEQLSRTHEKAVSEIGDSLRKQVYIPKITSGVLWSVGNLFVSGYS